MPWLLSPTNAIDDLKIGLYGEPEQPICTWSDIAGSNSDRHAPARSIRQEAELEHLPLADTRSSPDSQRTYAAGHDLSTTFCSSRISPARGRTEIVRAFAIDLFIAEPLGRSQGGHCEL
jgi:hypothetical protein